MKGTSVFLDHIAGRRAAAKVIDGRLDDILVDPPDDGPLQPGTICRATVERAIKGQGGLFVRLPDGKAFLRHAKGLAQGQPVLVQVSGHVEPGKAVPVSLKLLFKSKYAIVTPEAPGLNVSRRIREDERRVMLRSIAGEQMEGSDFGLILRSESETASDESIAEDIAEMRALAEEITSNTQGAPEVLLEGADSHALAWREWGAPDEIVTDAGCFAERGILDEIARLGTPEEPLPSGGHIYVEPTRAFVAVDVNTGADQSPAAALKANIEAARALPRALRLRGLGGQIAIDFAPLAKKDRRQIEQVLRSSFKADPIETALVGWTQMGNFEAQRKRERQPLDQRILEAAG